VIRVQTRQRLEPVSNPTPCSSQNGAFARYPDGYSRIGLPQGSACPIATRSQDRRRNTMVVARPRIEATAITSPIAPKLETVPRTAIPRTTPAWRAAPCAPCAVAANSGGLQVNVGSGRGNSQSTTHRQGDTAQHNQQIRRPCVPQRQPDSTDKAESEPGHDYGLVPYRAITRPVNMVIRTWQSLQKGDTCPQWRHPAVVDHPKG